jgi:hypothetical protein
MALGIGAVIIGPIFLTRFDVIPTSLAVLGLLLLARPLASGALLGIGAAIKVWRRWPWPRYHGDDSRWHWRERQQQPSWRSPVFGCGPVMTPSHFSEGNPNAGCNSNRSGRFHS